MAPSAESTTILITGGAGFIGSAVVRNLLEQTSANIVNLDALTYAADLKSLALFSRNSRYHFEKGNICNRKRLAGLLQEYQPAAIMHLAAESHVDRSIDDGDAFMATNIMGTYSLLEEARCYWSALPQPKKKNFRFLHVSTDEVYGSLGRDGKFSEESSYRPSSPYSASKAASDHLARSWHTTYGLPVLVSNCSNNYGPYQFPEKLIPLMIINGLQGKSLPIYGSGENIRDWLYVDDHARALALILYQGEPGETYNIGANEERRNRDLVTTICSLLDELNPSPGSLPHSGLITHVDDRPGHDLRYAIDATKIHNSLGWAPMETLESGLRRTVSWYIDNRDWWQPISQATYDGTRLGLGNTPPDVMDDESTHDTSK